LSEKYPNHVFLAEFQSNQIGHNFLHLITILFKNYV